LFKISHRGNLLGPSISLENSPGQIDKAINESYDCEVDIYVNKSKHIFLGHDSPNYAIDLDWLLDRKNYLWIHCKNLSALHYLTDFRSQLNFFFHDMDQYTLTSKGFIWAYPSQPFQTNTIVVLPEKFDEFWYLKIEPTITGICSDFIGKI
jgi:hypothetical protein